MEYSVQRLEKVWLQIAIGLLIVEGTMERKKERNNNIIIEIEWKWKDCIRINEGTGNAR